MKKIIFACFTICLCGCTNDEDIQHEIKKVSETRATRAESNVVWEAQPGSLDIPFGQSVLLGLDGTITKE